MDCKISVVQISNFDFDCLDILKTHKSIQFDTIRFISPHGPFKKRFNYYAI